MAESEMDEALEELDQGARIVMTSLGQVAEQAQLRQARLDRQEGARLRLAADQDRQDVKGLREAARVVYLAPGNATWWDTAEPADAVHAYRTAAVWADRAPEARRAQAAIADAAQRRWGAPMGRLQEEAEQRRRAEAGRAKVTAEDVIAVADDAAAARARAEQVPQEAERAAGAGREEAAEEVKEPLGPVAEVVTERGALARRPDELEVQPRPGSEDLAGDFRAAVGAGPGAAGRPAAEAVDEAAQERMAQALRAVWPKEHAEKVIGGEAFGAVTHHLAQLEKAGREPADVLRGVSPGEVTAPQIRHPAAFLAFRLEQVRSAAAADRSSSLEALPAPARAALEDSQSSFPVPVDAAIKSSRGSGPRVIKAAGVTVSQDYGR